MSLAVSFAQALSVIPSQIATILLAMFPIIELRGALPVAITIYKLPIWQAILWSVVGNMLPVYFLLVGFEKVSTWLRPRSALYERLYQKIINKARHKLHAQVEKYGLWALTLFVAVPLPMTGAWTGTVGAFVFGFNKKQAFFAILAGVIIASFITAAVTLGGVATYYGLTR